MASSEGERYDWLWRQGMPRFDLEKFQGHFRRGGDDLVAGLALDCQPGYLLARSQKDVLRQLFNPDCYMCCSHRHHPLSVRSSKYSQPLQYPMEDAYAARATSTMRRRPSA